jgi:hypothetical protein
LKQIYVPAALRRISKALDIRSRNLFKYATQMPYSYLNWVIEIPSVLSPAFMSQSPRVVEIELPTKDTGDVVAGENPEEIPASACDDLEARYLTSAAGLA